MGDRSPVAKAEEAGSGALEDPEQAVMVMGSRQQRVVLSSAQTSGLLQEGQVDCVVSQAEYVAVVGEAEGCVGGGSEEDPAPISGQQCSQGPL
tara:strand:+ start:7580 stop:7858 length:279 start_codon:yes stop_codon:yes gene_type:complete